LKCYLTEDGYEAIADNVEPGGAKVIAEGTALIIEQGFYDHGICTITTRIKSPRRASFATSSAAPLA
jgi:hypothetical protein